MRNIKIKISFKLLCECHTIMSLSLPIGETTSQIFRKTPNTITIKPYQNTFYCLFQNLKPYLKTINIKENVCLILYVETVPFLMEELKYKLYLSKKLRTFIDLPITEPLNFNFDGDIHQYVNFLLDDAIKYLSTSKKDSYNNFHMSFYITYCSKLLTKDPLNSPEEFITTTNNKIKPPASPWEFFDSINPLYALNKNNEVLFKCFYDHLSEKPQIIYLPAFYNLPLEFKFDFIL